MGQSIKVTVYDKPHDSTCTKPPSVQGAATVKALEKQGIVFDVVDVSKDKEAREYILELGYLQAPVVVAGGDHWSGFRPDRIKDLANRL